AALALVLLGGGCSGTARVPPAPAAPEYVDASAAVGLTGPTWAGSRSKDHLLESVGSGAAFVDLDGDGDDDLLVLSGWRLDDVGPDGGPRRVVSRGGFA